MGVLGADWRWVERLRPYAVLSGLGFAPLLEAELSAALVASLIWWAIAWFANRGIINAVTGAHPVDRQAEPPGDGDDRLLGARAALQLLVQGLPAGRDPDRPPSGLDQRPPQ